MDKINHIAKVKEDPAEVEFRKKNQWYSFTGHLYSALGGAAFIGLLATVVKGLVSLAAATPGTAAATEAAAFFGAGPLALMGGLMAAGAASIYMAQKQFTELKMIGDEHLAVQNAKKLMQPNVQVAAGVIHHPQNERSDGKKWQDVVATREAEQMQEQGRA